jgi:hypothetical protein
VAPLAKAARSWLVRIVIGLGTAGLVASCILLLRATPHLIFMSQFRKMEHLLDTLPERRPEAVSDKTWDAAVRWTGIASANVCFSTSHVPLPEMKRFVKCLEKRMSEPVDLDTIEWIWDRLDETGPHGKRYVANWRPEYRREVEYWQNNNSMAGSK